MPYLDVSPAFVFLDHGYVQTAGREWHGKRYILYHSNSILKSHDVRGAIAFTNEDSIGLGLRIIAMSFERGFEQHEGHLDGEAVMADGCNKRPYSGKSEPNLTVFTLGGKRLLEKTEN